MPVYVIRREDEPSVTIQTLPTAIGAARGRLCMIGDLLQCSNTVRELHLIPQV